MKKLRTHFLICFLLIFGFSGIAQDSCNCCSENHKAFDFWIGSWDVVNPDGSAAGKSTIVKSEGDCVVRENWVSAKDGYTGTSTNFYNKVAEEWEQLWVDNSGAHLKLKGNRKKNQMILSSTEVKNKSGVLIKNRITWTSNDDGTVRQLWEITHEGKVISVAFDGLYKKVE
ncbi:hypothetical protein [Maribacter sp. HTCC2170]|uniref:hypothetical protein n=1 Tax=Maribacter sp. (strain HTCC2170 / KCCM 42371) TaxID=313603 RepID=UPI00006BE094|nr:hypothetical protein [Maribacter sp. HTCC2170]EAQ99961.1 hypothetical protein FB2170_01267 [Maribacter sp. HTCC2170]